MTHPREGSCKRVYMREGNDRSGEYSYSGRSLGVRVLCSDGKLEGRDTKESVREE